MIENIFRIDILTRVTPLIFVRLFSTDLVTLNYF